MADTQTPKVPKADDEVPKADDEVQKADDEVQKADDEVPKPPKAAANGEPILQTGETLQAFRRRIIAWRKG